MTLVGEQEVGGRKRLEQLKQPCRCLDADILEVWRGIGYADGQGGEEGIQARRGGNRVNGLLISSNSTADEAYTPQS
jgi:hypothetical protein